MRPIGRNRRSFVSLRALAAAALAACAFAAAPARAASERFHVDLEASKLFDRFQSHEADSLGLSVSSTSVLGARWAFRVLDVPAGKITPKPSLTLTGRLATMERTIGGQANGSTIGHAPVLEITSGVKLSLPLDMLPGNGGVAFNLGYEGGYVMAREGGADFLTTSALAFGFERTAGAFEGSYLEIGQGRNETFGSDFASGRWRARVFLQSELGLPRAEAAKPADPKAAAPASADEKRLRVFLQLDVDTDGKDGPDGIGFNVGLAMDAGTMFRRALGVIGM